MNEIVISDAQIEHFNIGKKDNEESSIVYKYKDGLHWINLSECAMNFQALHPKANRCVAERDITNFSFTFFTSGIFTKIVFKKRFLTGLFNDKLLKGSRAQRFHAFSKMIDSCGYTTYDLS